MISVQFKNLESSSLTRDAVLRRMSSVVSKFPALRRSRMVVTLEMENSPLQPGRDQFSVRATVRNGRYRGIVIEKADSNLFVALASLTDRMLELVGRQKDRRRRRALGFEPA